MKLRKPHQEYGPIRIKKNGDRLHSMEVNYNETAEYYKGIPGEYTSYVYTDSLSATDLVRLRDWLEADDRGYLEIPYPEASAGVSYEHSMGQNSLPNQFLKSSSQPTPLNQLQ